MCRDHLYRVVAPDCWIVFVNWQHLAELLVVRMINTELHSAGQRWPRLFLLYMPSVGRQRFTLLEIHGIATIQEADTSRGVASESLFLDFVPANPIEIGRNLEYFPEKVIGVVFGISSTKCEFVIASIDTPLLAKAVVAELAAVVPLVSSSS